VDNQLKMVVGTIIFSVDKDLIDHDVLVFVALPFYQEHITHGHGSGSV